MRCLICRDLERAFDARRSEYIEARCSASYRVCTKAAADKYVDMERAKSELEEQPAGVRLRRVVCTLTARSSASSYTAGSAPGLPR